VTEKNTVDRRNFLKGAAGALGASAQGIHWPVVASAQALPAKQVESPQASLRYPRQFRGRQLQMISFPLGGVTAGSIGLGGRGQLCDWEIRNHPHKGYRPPYAFPAIWVQVGSAEPVARVLEARLQSPYEGPSGLDSQNVPGLSRLETAVFTGEYPLAHIAFEDASLPVKVELEAFSPFIPHEPDDSGLPVAVLRYRVTNPGHSSAKVGIAFSIENPVRMHDSQWSSPGSADEKRTNTYRTEGSLAGLVMTNPGLAADDANSGNFVLAAAQATGARISHWTGWPKGRWWNGPLLFWDQFSKYGEMGTDPDPHSNVGVVCVQRTIAPGASASFEFLLAWHFPNRTPDACGWTAPPGEGKTIIGNYYSARFKDAWEAVAYTAAHLESLEARTRQFAKVFRESTLPDLVKDAASANLSTLATTTCFRTADGEFHGFEGSNDTSGCCPGNCLHVWNYETVTPFLFPSFARSLRKSAFGYSQDAAGAMHFRQLLPDGKARLGLAAADGQMGQIVHTWLDWKLSGDQAWLRDLWPHVKKAIEFAWVPNGWDSNKDGVLEGVQHTTYDVEFYGPNPMCGIYYLAALRAGVEMAEAVGDSASAHEYKRLSELGRQWIDANLFNGRYYIQKVRGVQPDQIAANIRSDFGSEGTENPEYQVGGGCLVDQLVGQYMADVGGLGAVVDAEHIQTTLRSIQKYNFKASLMDHENVARTYALNNEAAVVICDYGTAERPRIPFPYYSEAWTGLEYTVAALMMNWGMVNEGIECVRNVRLRYDGERRNPWDEAECGHHYARAMSSWSTVVALSGFFYDGAKRAVIAVPRLPHANFDCFWATATGWGSFSYRQTASGSVFTIDVITGTLPCRSFAISGAKNPVVRIGDRAIVSQAEMQGERMIVVFEEDQHLSPETSLRIESRI
jgi:non-lysosomal glucosylceramidase